MMQFEATAPERALRFAPEHRQKSAGRRAWTATALMVAGTLAIALTSYSISLKVSAERAEAAKLSRANVALQARLKSLEAELRVRMRLPQLQRWNDEVLALQPVTAQQYLGNWVSLAAYGTAPAAALATLQPAFKADMAPRADTGLALAAAVIPRSSGPASTDRATAAPARNIVRVASAPGAAMAEAPPVDPQLLAAIEALGESGPNSDAPADLLRQVDMPAAPPGGN